MVSIVVTGLGLLLLFALCLGTTDGVTFHGSPWPLPARISISTNTLILDRGSFRFRATGASCDILEEAFVRYFRIIFDNDKEREVESFPQAKDTVLRFLAKRNLDRLDVNVLKQCEQYPSLGMDESYTLSVSSRGSQLTASAIWGALRGLETFSQLIYYSNDGNLQVNETEISDKPRFSWRGILLDTSRHFLSKDAILQNLDAMAYNKFNVFHWHIVDDNSFPYQSKKFPELSLKGAYEPYRHVYTQNDIRDIIQFARLRGIRVVPEFDSPGHSTSWGKGIPNLLTKCYNKGNFTGNYGPVDPSQGSTYTFFNSFIEELTEVFRDRYLHLGGDEVSFSCWQSNPNITDFMERMKFGKDYRKLESFYINILLKITANFRAKAVVWQEVFDNGVQVTPDTVIHVWKGGEQKELEHVTAAGQMAILSSPWYLSRISFGSDWHAYYQVEPLNFNGTDRQKALVLGGEACLWGEFVDATNMISRLWPRASAVGERLWSTKEVNNITDAAVRLDEHRCRMIRRGINAEPPNGPGFCPFEIGQDETLHL